MVHKILLSEQLDNLCVHYRGKNITSYIIWGRGEWGGWGKAPDKCWAFYLFSVSPHCRISNLTVVFFWDGDFRHSKLFENVKCPTPAQAPKYFKINFVHCQSHDLHEQGLLWGTWINSQLLPYGYLGRCHRGSCFNKVDYSITGTHNNMNELHKAKNGNSQNNATLQLCEKITSRLASGADFMSQAGLVCQDEFQPSITQDQPACCWLNLEVVEQTMAPTTNMDLVISLIFVYYFSDSAKLYDLLYLHLSLVNEEKDRISD